MRVIIALGGNALLRRGEPLTIDNQRRNVAMAADALAPLAEQHELIITHGNGPQVGLLALQGVAYRADESYPLDVLDAETEGMIGYLIEQELSNVLPHHRRCVTLLTQIEVAVDDPSFAHSSKPIGPLYDEAEAQALAELRGWHVSRDGQGYRRVVPSPTPRRILELDVIELLVDQGIIVICGGGGGIPVVRSKTGGFVGVEAVIDKDAASALLARELGAHALLMLTDIDAVYSNFDTANARAIRCIAPEQLRAFWLAPGSMAPKVAAAVEFVEHSEGIVGIGQLKDAQGILAGDAGTMIQSKVDEILWWE